MRGDFSRWRDERRQNFNGVLHQQGRVLLDGDWNAQTALTNDWQDTAGRDAFGSGVAAVPADEPLGFKILSAALVGGQVRLKLAPGRAWADGLLARLEGPNTGVERVAQYLQPPVVAAPAPGEGTIAQGVRDAVVLELWREEMNGFQMPEELIEPALGGPDTTERVHTAMAIRLFRMTDPEDTCDSIIDDLRDNFGTKGKLTVTLDAPVVVGGDCPVTDDGGYTGFEHNLYRVEVAQTNSGTPSFKWSQFGGGLVGRGKFDAAKFTLTIDANDQAIINSGLQEFYLEAYRFNPLPPASPASLGTGHWEVFYGATVTLNSGTGVFSLPPVADPKTIFGAAIPGPAATSYFFRLWNGIKPIADFDGPNPAELQDGIMLKFQPAVGANYAPGDYWTFPVRAGDIGNQPTLVNNQPPEGIHYHRVPLGVLHWQNPADPNNPADIEDCRRIFQPLTKLTTCCTYRVGDGKQSHGDFLKIQDAVNALPADGGKVCVLPGVYEENVLIKGRRNITIEGCGRRTRVVSEAPSGNSPAAPVFHVVESQRITIRSLAVEADAEGLGIHLEGRPLEVTVKDNPPKVPLLNVTLEDLHVRASGRSAIHAEVCYFTAVRGCCVEMDDVLTAGPAVFFSGDDGLVEQNHILVTNAQLRLAGFDVTSQQNVTLMGKAAAALGGLTLGGGSERVRVLDNFIARGNGVGIELGQIVTVTETGDRVPPQQPPPKPDPCKDGDKTVRDPDPNTKTHEVSAGDLYDIQIVGNRIFNMGLDGIGVAGFFPLGKLDQFISVHGLLIDSNEIRFCLNRTLKLIDEAMLKAMGYGGIALADVDDLVVRDNVITDNGPDFREPVCGIFVLHGEGIEISRNRILNNGVKPPDASESNAAVKRGARGGIHIAYAVAPRISVTIFNNEVPVQDGAPALLVHDNVVGVPVGRALSAGAVGPVTVVGNQFTTRGAVSGDTESLLAATVMIVNLGLSNEFYLQLIFFVMLLNQNVKSAEGGQPGLDDAGVGRFLLGGNVLFAGNQCMLDLIDAELNVALTSVLIMTLDDVGFHDNQSDCNLLGDFLFFNVVLFGISVRMTDNRLKESVSFFSYRKDNTFKFSALTLGLFNTTTDNQSTYCLLILGLPNLTVDHSNVSLVMINSPTACCNFLMHKEQCRGRGQIGAGPPTTTPAPPQPGGPTTVPV